MKNASHLLHGALASALLLTPLSASAQTFFGSGSGTNGTASPSQSNVGLGYQVLFYNTAGGLYNTAVGYQSLYSNTIGGYNSANGAGSLYANTTGSSNSAFGFASLYANTTGSDNSAFGSYSLYTNTTGNGNTATGYNAMTTLSSGDYNTAVGYQAMENSTQSSWSIAVGANSLYYNTTGKYNLGVGMQSLYYNTTGHYNVAIGYDSLYNMKRGAYNIALGHLAGYNITSGSNNIAIGNQGNAADNGTIRIGTSGTHSSTLIAGINGATLGSGVAVFIDPNGMLGTITSSRRFKNDIKSMGSLSDKLMQLRPVTFKYKDSAEKGVHTLQYGLIAEEVAKVAPELVQRDKAGKPFTVRYHLLTPMLINELQKERASRKAEVAELKATQTAKLNAVIAELAQQKRLLSQLAAYIQSGKKSVAPEKANFVQH